MVVDNKTFTTKEAYLPLFATFQVLNATILHL